MSRGRAHVPSCLQGRREGPRQVRVARAQGSPCGQPVLRTHDGPRTRSRSGLVGVLSVVPEATGPRDVKEGVAYIRCPVLEPPPPPALLALSQQPGHCLRPRPQPSAAVVAIPRGTQAQCPGSPGALPPLGFGASHRTAAEAPARADVSQVLSSRGGGRVRTDVPRSSGAGLGAPRCRPLRSLRGARALRSALPWGARGGLSPSAPPSCPGRSRSPPAPGCPCLVAANSGGGDWTARAAHTSPRG